MKAMLGRAAARLGAALGVLAIFLALTITPASAAPTIQGAGSSFMQLEIEQWRSDVARAPYGLKVNYVSSGSTFGRNQYMDNLVDFGASDVPFQPEETGKASQRPYTYVPVSAGGVSFMYNLRDKSGRRVGVSAAQGGSGTNLKLSSETVCRMFTTKGMNWNDPAIAAENPDIALPNAPIVQVIRADGAGTGFVFMEYCIATQPQLWQSFVAAAKSKGLGDQAFLEGRPSGSWPDIGYVTAFAGDGVANTVVTRDSSITYVEAGFAEVRGFPNALVKNAAGKYVYPEAVNVNKALSYAQRNADGTVTLNFSANDPVAYFPSTYSYVIAPKNIDADKAKVLKTFLYYAVTKGQAKADELGYAPLSREMVDIAYRNISEIPGDVTIPEIVTYIPQGDSSKVEDTGSATGDPTTPPTGTPSTGTPSNSGGGGGDNPASNPPSDSGGGAQTDPGSGGGNGGEATQGGAAAGAAGAAAARATGGGATGATGVATTQPKATGASGNAATNNATKRAPGSQLASAAAPVEREPRPGPSNGDVAIAVLQGAAICAAGAAVARRVLQKVGAP